MPLNSCHGKVGRTRLPAGSLCLLSLVSQISSPGTFIFYTSRLWEAVEKPTSQGSTSFISRVVREINTSHPFRPGVEARTAGTPTVLGIGETGRAWPSPAVTGTTISVDSQSGNSPSSPLSMCSSAWKAGEAKKILRHVKIGTKMYNIWSSLVAHTVKNPPAMWETWIGKIPWRRAW